MLLVFGWAIIKTSESVYVDVDPLSIRADEIDDELKIADKALRDELGIWLKSNADIWFEWQFTAEHNNHSGLLQFHTSRNHRGGTTTWPLIEFIANQSKGSYGLVFVHDDEDERAELSFKVWRILDGKVTEHDDPFLSPFTSHHAFGGYPEVWGKS